MSELKKRDEIKDEFKWKVEKIYTYKKSAEHNTELIKHNQELFKLLIDKKGVLA